MSEHAQTTDLAVIEDRPQAIVEADPKLVVEAFENYVEIQRALDATLPDAIMEIQGKRFRKKVYWRAIATAFNLQLELQEERREETDGDWGYLITYRATAGNGRSCDGDGSCFASEKSGAMCTVHNVRAHAHTRAKNRAIADLVGFGEVSAEEVSHSAAPASRSTPKTAAGGAVKLASASKVNLLWGKSFARSTGQTGDKGAAKEIFFGALNSMGIKSKEEVPDDAIDSLVAYIEKWRPAADEGDPF